VVTLAAAAGGYALFGSSSDPYRTISPFPVQDYLDNANSLRGNVYKVDGTIAKSLQWSPNAGRLFSIDLAGSGNDVVPSLFLQGQRLFVVTTAEPTDLDRRHCGGQRNGNGALHDTTKPMGFSNNVLSSSRKRPAMTPSMMR